LLITWITPFDRSAIHANFLPLLTSGRARLLDSSRLIGQLANLERRTQPSGKDRIDHPAGAHDDLSNAAAGALVLASDWSAYDSMDWVGELPEAWGGNPLARHPFFEDKPWLLR